MLDVMTMDTMTLDAQRSRSGTPDSGRAAVNLAQASLALARFVEERLGGPPEVEVVPMAVEGDELVEATLCTLPPEAAPNPIGLGDLETESCEEILDRGLDRCRSGDWRVGIRELVRAAQAPDRPRRLPASFYSFLGYGLAKVERRVQDGLRLCRHAIQLEFYQSEHYVNLARVLLLAGDRRGAWDMVEAGLKIDIDAPELVALRRELGARRPPVLRFLGRRNLLNRLLGRIRHDLTGSIPA